MEKPEVRACEDVIKLHADKLSALYGSLPYLNAAEAAEVVKMIRYSEDRIKTLRDRIKWHDSKSYTPAYAPMRRRTLRD